MRPERPPVFDPNDARFWDPRDLEKELERVFSVCHGCRMCVGFCPAFPELFARVDGYVDRKKGEIDAFDNHDYAAVNDLCYQCKLCYFKCPYTPDDGHPFLIDFPRLMLRQKAQSAARDGVTVQDQVLGEPQLLGKLASGPQASLGNLVSASRLLRKAQEITTGMSADFNLPPFAPESLFTWLDKRTPLAKAGEAGDIVLFATCTATFNLPAAGRATVQVLEHNGHRVIAPREQTCCGMPNLDGGDMNAAKEKAARNVAALFPHAKAGLSIVAPGPTCSYVLKKEYPELLGTPEAELVASSTFDVMEYLRKLMREKKLNREFEKPLGQVAYHAPCHLRAQKVGFPAMQVLSKIEGTEVTVIEQCSAVDGTWGMKAQNFELGRKYARNLVRAVEAIEDRAYVATDCPLSGLRLAQETGREALHPIELLNEAYGLPSVRDAFTTNGLTRAELDERQP